MPEMELRDLLMIYPFTKPTGIFDRKRARLAREMEQKSPYTTNEGVIALQKFSLTVEHGEFLVLLGPSGCGKTTLLRLIAGLETPVQGQILMDGKCVNELPPEQRDIAMVFQNFSLYPHLDVYENLAFTLKNQRVPRDELDARVREVAEILQLTRVLDRRPKELSGGQQQRVAIGRAIIRRPKLFLMDEPFSNLDPALRGQLREAVRRLHAHLGTTFVYVTHDQKEALSLGTRIVVMKDGMLQQEGSPRDVFNRPVNRFVASIVGEPPMNFFENCPVFRESRTVEVLGKRFRLPSCPDRDRVTVGIRPVHMEVGAGEIPGTLEQALPLGSETLLTVKTDGGSVRVVVPESQGLPWIRGQQVLLSVEPRRLHLFDPETELRL